MYKRQVTFVKDSVGPGSVDSICINNKTIYRIYRGTDVCGNDTTCIQQITINDNIPPALVGVPNDTTVLCVELVPAPATVTATDNCATGAKVIFTADTINKTCANEMTIRRFYTAMDSCNNMTLDTMIITVNDTVKPILVGIPNDTMVSVSYTHLDVYKRQGQYCLLFWYGFIYY